jgi:hypothetical protein
MDVLMASMNARVIILLILVAQLFIPIVIIWIKSRKIDPGFPMVSEEVVHFRHLKSVFIAFLISFGIAAFLLLKKILPTNCTYEAVFGPVIVVGIFWFGALLRKAKRERTMTRLIGAFFGMFLLANFVDLTLIKLGAWTFSDLTNLKHFDFTWLLGRTMLDKEITVPWVEIFGFNGTIAWFIFFCGVFLNRMINKNAFRG